MSKAAVDQMTRSVALELADRSVRVNAVNPGVIVTDIHKRGGMSERDYQQVSCGTYVHYRFLLLCKNYRCKEAFSCIMVELKVIFWRHAVSIIGVDLACQ